MKWFLNEESGQGMVEYALLAALLAALIAIVAIVAIGNVGKQVDTKFSTISSALK